MKSRSWWRNIREICAKFGYFSKLTSIVIVVKPNFEENAKEIFISNIYIKTAREEHLGAAIGSQIYQKAHKQILLKHEQRKNELILLSKISDI